MPAQPLPFRTGNVLATSFTGTLSERHGEPVERIPTSDRLLDWLSVNDLAVDSCTAQELHLARRLRESIHRAATAAALEEALPRADLDTLNEHSARGRAAAYLTPSGRLGWRLGAHPGVQDALGVVATDAIRMIAEQGERLALCASPTCRAIFLDTSQSRTRRWCDMNTCGNRQKKARFKANHS